MSWRARPSAAARLVAGAAVLGVLGGGAHMAVSAELPPLRTVCRDLGTVRHPDGTAVGGVVCRPNRGDLLARQLMRERRAHRAERVRLMRALAYRPSVQEAISLAAFVYGVPRSTLSSLVACESNFNPGALNRYTMNGGAVSGSLKEAQPESAREPEPSVWTFCAFGWPLQEGDRHGWRSVDSGMATGGSHDARGSHRRVDGPRPGRGEASARVGGRTDRGLLSGLGALPRNVRTGTGEVGV